MTGKKAVFAASLGTAFEWYDFFVYGELAALDKNSVGRWEQEEVLFVMYAMRQDILLV